MKMKEDKYCDWRVKQALHTLTEAEEIKKDAKMMSLVRKEALKQQKAVNVTVKTIDEYNKMSAKDKARFIAGK